VWCVGTSFLGGGGGGGGGGGPDPSCCIVQLMALSDVETCNCLVMLILTTSTRGQQKTGGQGR